MAKETEKLYDLIKDFDTAMLVTQRADGALDARPMQIAGVEKSCDLWFITDADTEKVREIESNPRAEVVAQDGDSNFVALAGSARVVDDRRKLDELWDKSYEVWFPEGKADPRIRLIAFDAERGEYWDNRGLNRVEYLLESARARAAGRRPHVKEGDQHGKTRL
ncbi:MAG TPA: pyridoxamine 5'-phosphate oxidase family protein [Longimicrobiales bacterium]|nr:pyridoxamine 5'-phosphate oxidase family protein [Longimicrobiales bacterium]